VKYCPIYKKCGGCAYINEEYEKTLLNKHEYVQKLFGKIKVDEVKGMKDPYHYRHKIYASFYSDKYNQIHAGLYEENSHRLIDSKMCLIQHVKANDILRTMCTLAQSFKIEPYNEDTGRGVLRHAYIRISRSTGKVMLVIVIGSKGLPSSKNYVKKLVEAHPEIETVIINYNHEHTSMILGRKSDVVYGKGYITDQIGNLLFRISPQSFYQVNPEQTEVIYNTALEMAQLKKTDTVLDVCCGIGTIALSAAPLCKEVIGVEINEQAIRDAEKNMKLNGIENVEFYAEDAERFIQRLDTKPDVVFLDPPRSGMSEPFIRTLNRLAPKKIVYVSCNPATQIRDIRLFAKAGYRVQKAVPVDNFPFTKHVETCALLVRESAHKDETVSIKVNTDGITVDQKKHMHPVKPTYENIQRWIKEKYGMNVSTLYIAQIKDKVGIDKQMTFKDRPAKGRVPNYPLEKEEAIMDAFRHFRMI